MTATQYDQQAADFVAATGITITKVYQAHQPYFRDDNKKRAVWEILVSHKDRKPWVFKFGNSIADSYRNSGKWNESPQRLKPSDYSILASLTKSDPGSHSEFCSEYGYDIDSIKGRDTWQAVCEEWANVRRMLSPDEIEKLAEIS